MTRPRNRRVDYEGFVPPPRRETPGFRGFLVGDDGVVYGRSGQPLKRYWSGGRLMLHGSGMADDGRAWIPVAEVVCTAFHGPRPSLDHVAKTLGSDPYDNRPENVAWVLKKSAQKGA